MIRSLRCPSSNVNSTVLTYNKDLCYTRSWCKHCCQGTISWLTNSSFSLNRLPLILRTNVELNEPLIQYVYQRLCVPVCLYLFLSVNILLSSVLYTPTACPTDSVGLSLDPAISNGPSGQSIGSPLESIGHDWILLLVQPKSSESPLKPLKSKKWLDWLEFCVRWTSTGLPLHFWWTEAETSHIC